MPKLQLIKLACHQTEDWTGPDEAYLMLDGNKIWGPMSLNNGQDANLSSMPPIAFTGVTSLQLYDQDTGVLDPDDFLGAVSIGAGVAGQGLRSGNFNGDGAHYTIYYEVQADPSGAGSAPPDNKKPVFPIVVSKSGARGSVSLTIDDDGFATMHMKVDAAHGAGATRYVASFVVTGYKDGDIGTVFLSLDAQSLTVEAGTFDFGGADKSRSWTYQMAAGDANSIRHVRLFLERDKSQAQLYQQIIDACRKAGETWDAADALYKKIKHSELGQDIALAAV